MNKKLDVIGLIGLILTLFTILFGDDVYRQINGSSVFEVPSTNPAISPTPIVTTPTQNVETQFFVSSPTPTIVAFFVPTVMQVGSPSTPTSSCEIAQYVLDLTIPDGTIMSPNQRFIKKWRVQNIGSCSWEGFSLAFDSGEQMGGPASNSFGVVNPGQGYDFELNLTSPSVPGSYRGYWKIYNASNIAIPMVNGFQDHMLYLEIVVK